ncbi:alpha/beta hydrolase family protein [Prosthecobacter fusiformis]|uniref:alpha/beta hydrolase family protein n=1 Tax=Prosthecobacter fusiformis TaxID=48464 RepID=UPI001AAF3B5B|nr:alpha/beta fold hydrolase [Prosthecobacter fusiformis]
MLRRLILAVVFLFLVLAATLTWWAGSELASPSRRTLQDYHLEFLGDAAGHGMRLEKFTLNDGTPCLMCLPEPTGRLGTRGQSIREQFAKRGLPLPNAGEVHGTLVLTHGRKGRKEDYLPIAERLCAVGFRCLLADMPAHGDHPSALLYYGVREAGLPASVLKEAVEKFHFAPQPAGLLGMSMGGSVAMYSAGQPDAPWKALAIISSFHAFQPAMELQASRMAGSFLGKPWAAGAGWLYEWKTGLPLSAIQPQESAARLKIPTLILHGTDDKIVPIESGRKLYAALPEDIEKQWVEIPTADHHNVLITEFPVYATISEWMLKHVR